MNPRRLGLAIRLVATVQARNGFPQVYLGVALVTGLGVRLALPESFRSVAVPAFLLGEPGSLGLYLAAAHAYLARNEGSDVAQSLTPLTQGEWVSALALTTGILATAAGVLFQGLVLGFDARCLWLCLPLFPLAVLAGLVGIAVSTRFEEFTRFLMGSIPVVALSLVPIAAMVGWVHWGAIVWIPDAPALAAFSAIVEDRVEIDWLALQAGISILWAALFFALAVRGSQRRLAEAEAS